jgi:hypothetical protein
MQGWPGGGVTSAEKGASRKDGEAAFAFLQIQKLPTQASAEVKARRRLNMGSLFLR